MRTFTLGFKQPIMSCPRCAKPTTHMVMAHSEFHHGWYSLPCGHYRGPFLRYMEDKRLADAELALALLMVEG